MFHRYLQHVAQNGGFYNSFQRKYSSYNNFPYGESRLKENMFLKILMDKHKAILPY